MSMERWEYTKGFIGKGLDDTEFLNEAGSLGWECFKVEDTGTSWHFWFKRPLPRIRTEAAP